MLPDIELQDKMFYWFFERTERHITLVQKYCKRLSLLKDLEGILERGEDHDMSKFEAEEAEPYMWLSWWHKSKAESKSTFEMPEDIKNRIKEATLHHILSNRHHPEFHQERKVDLLNNEDRDKPPKRIVDATRMENLDIAEMVADWCAMSEEKGNTPVEWAEANVNIRWKFTEQQTLNIYKYIHSIWKE